MIGPLYISFERVGLPRYFDDIYEITMTDVNTL